MEKVLYEYNLNIDNILLSLIPLSVGIVFLTNSIMLIRRKKSTKGWNEFVDSFFKFSGLIIGLLGIIMFLMIGLGIWLQHENYKELLKNNETHTVEGYVENYYPMPYEGHDTERFEINGVYFEYSDYIMTNGYNVTASHGGVITRNGQHLKIKYATEEYDGDENNIILYISEIS